MNTTFERTDSNDEWLTPPDLIKALGEFDLDPCSPINRPWDTARAHFNKDDDGLNRPWTGRVWMNPPYGTMTGKWLQRLKMHGNGIALIFARTETQQFFDHIWHDADAVLFVKGRIRFCYVDGTHGQSAGAPSVFVAYGQENARMLHESGIKGKFITLKVAA
jgi:hypothetical protein